MLASIDIRNFRSFEYSNAKRLRRLNFVTGKNGSGKTTLLEAIFLNCAAGNAVSTFTINTQRGDIDYNLETDTSFRSLFHKLDITNPVMIDCEEIVQKRRRMRSLRISPTFRQKQAVGGTRTDDLVNGLSFSFKRVSSEEVTGSIRLTMPPTLPVQLFGQAPQQMPLEIVNPHSVKDVIFAAYISPYAHNVKLDIYNKLLAATKDGTVGNIVRTLLLIQPNIKNLVPIMDFGQANIYVDVGLGKLMPVTNLGSGFLILLRIALEINTFSNGILVIDELEDGLHYSVIPGVLRLLIEHIKATDIQIFISTHSDELIHASIKTAKEENFSDLCLINVAPGKSQLNARYFDFDELDFAVEADAELR